MESYEKFTHSRVIAKVVGNRGLKTMDFSDGLTRANDYDYAQIMGVGGKNHATNSVIRINITDKSNGSNTYVRGTVEPYVIQMILDFCRSPHRTQSSPNIAELLAYTRAIAKRFPNDIPRNEFISVGTKLAEIAAKPSMDFHWESTKINPYTGDADGKHDVTTVLIYHKPMRDGKEVLYPWTVKVENGKSRLVKKENGACQFDGKAYVKTAEAYISLSGAEMYRCMYSVNNYINAFVQAFGIPLVYKARSEIDAKTGG